MALGETVGVEDDDRNCLDENGGREGFGSSLPDVVEGGREWKRMKTGRTNCASGSPNQLQATMPSESIKIPEMKRPAEALDESRGPHGEQSDGDHHLTGGTDDEQSDGEQHPGVIAESSVSGGGAVDYVAEYEKKISDPNFDDTDKFRGLRPDQVAKLKHYAPER